MLTAKRFPLIAALLGLGLSLGCNVNADVKQTAAHPAEIVLLMFEQAHCSFCDRWHRDVGDGYASSPEGKRAPLIRIDIHDAPPARFKAYASINLTPTFILVKGDEEIGRMPGYLGEDFFWGYLNQFLEQAEAENR